MSLIDQIEQNTLYQFLRGSILFQDADDASLAIAVKYLELIKIKKGDPIILENEISDHVYFLYSGTAEVVKNIAELNQLSRVAVLRPGSQFSEFSVLNRANKAASVFALEDSELLRMSGDNFLEVLQQLPSVGYKLVQHLAKMTQHTQTSKFRINYVKSEDIVLSSQIPQILPPKTWKKYGVLPLRFENRSLFLAVKDPQNKALFTFIKNSQPNIHIYISLINETDFDAAEADLSKAYGGEIPKYPPKPVAPALEGEPQNWLPSVSIFKEVPADWFAQLAEYISFENYTQGQNIYKQGGLSERMYILVSGLVDIYRQLAYENAALHVATLQPGDYFSEISLVANMQHIMSARAVTPVRVAVISKDMVERLLQVPVFAVPFARDMAIQFQSISSAASFKYFDASAGVQVKELANLLPKSVMAQYEILPLRLVENELTIGITNPESSSVYSVISRYLCDHRVTLEVIYPVDFKKWFAIINAENHSASATVGHGESVNLVRGDAVSILDQVLAAGFNGRSSDIHFEPNGENFVIRFRIDGVLQEGSDKFSTELGQEIINRIKILSGLDITNKFTPQDGQMKLELAGQKAFARVSILPAKKGETAVLRLIRQRDAVPPLSMVVPDKRVINIFNDVVHSKQGIFLITGPTGSGKTTTLYSLIQELNRVEVNIISLEDPVEMEIAGTTQVEMNEKVGLTFATALKSALRQDPNVIMLGEIRDEESAKIVFHAASTGHLVISTLHTNNSLNVVPRLLELGISKGIMASTLIGASAQRLLRQVCKECRALKPIEESEIELIKSETNIEQFPTELAYGRGCPKCNGSGYSGRIPIIEIWQKSKAVEALLLQGASDEELALCVRDQKFETLRQFAFKMALSGLTTIEEVFRGLGGPQIVVSQSDVQNKSAA